MAVQVVGDVSRDQHEFEVELSHNLFESGSDGEIVLRLDDSPVGSDENMHLPLNVNRIHHENFNVI